MSGKSLFLKIFLWFLGVLLLMATVSVVLTQVMISQGILLSGRESILTNAVRNHGATCLEIYEERGTDALAEATAKIRNETALGLHFFREDGTSLVPFPGDERIRESAFAALKRGESFANRQGLSLVFQRIVSSRGNAYIVVGLLPKRPLFPLIGPNRRVLPVYLAGLACTAGLLCFWLARHIARPVGRLNEVTQAMARGEFSVRVEKDLKNRGDEIGQLGRSFDDMARHVEALLEAQQRLLRDISHELRSPLARLNVALALARQRAGAEIQGALARIEKEAEALNELIGQLLSLARVEADLGRILTAPEDLVALVREVVADADFEARARGCTVRFEAAEALPPLLLNADLVRSAVENVVRNALHHTAPETEVEVSVLSLVENGGRCGLVRIRDHGPGVPEEELENLFRPFYRLDASRGRESGGVGLGLAIARRAVQLHGGRIDATNVRGGGLCVELRFPEGSEGLDGTPSGQTDE